MTRAFVPNARRVRFDLHLRIIDLNNVPLVSGTSFIKWHLPSSTAAEHRGSTAKAAIHDHRVHYDYEKRVQVRLVVGKDGVLSECAVDFDVMQEYSAGHERIRLGHVRLNLAEYVDASTENPNGSGTPPSSSRGGGADNDSLQGGGAGGGEDGVVRRYLMQDSKINSTLKVGITMRYIDGTRDFSAPPLRTAAVFGGIAGIIQSGEPSTAGGIAGGVVTAAGLTSNNGAAEDPTQDGGGGSRGVPNLSAYNKELGESQDMYRRTLTAFWASQPGELKADECVEDIFAGGDGWRRDSSKNAAGGGIGDRKEHDGEVEVSSTNPSGPPTPNADADVQSRELNMLHKGRGILNRQQQAGSREGHRHHHHHSARRHHDEERRKGRAEVDEFEIRDDLKSWRVAT